MTVSGQVRYVDGQACSGCQVMAFTEEQAQVHRARTDASGRFLLVRLPAGTYRLHVAGPDGRVVLASDPASPLGGNPGTLVIRERTNLSGLALVAPPPTPVDDDILSTLDAERDIGWSPQPGVSDGPLSPTVAPTPRPVFTCGPDKPAPREYLGRIAFAIKRGSDEELADDDPPQCGKDLVGGCVNWLTEVRPMTGAPGRPDCSSDGVIRLPLVIENNMMFIHKPDWGTWSPQPPGPAECVEIRKPDCGAYYTYGGIFRHECTHRVNNEIEIDNLFREYLLDIQRIQAKVAADGGCYLCCLKHLPEADKAHVKVVSKMSDLIDADPGPGSETEARAEECRYYKERFAATCALPLQGASTERGAR
jgi:hypothetical protein